MQTRLLENKLKEKFANSVYNITTESGDYAGTSYYQPKEPSFTRATVDSRLAVGKKTKSSPKPLILGGTRLSGQQSNLGEDESGNF